MWLSEPLNLLLRYVVCYYIEYHTLLGTLTLQRQSETHETTSQTIQNAKVVTESRSVVEPSIASITPTGDKLALACRT